MGGWLGTTIAALTTLTRLTSWECIMSKSRVLAVLGASLCMAALLGCVGPATLVAGAKASADEQAAGATGTAVNQSTLPPELVGLSDDELCALMCQSMGGPGAAMCQAMHAAGINMDMGMMLADPATVEQLAAAARAAQAQ